MKTKLIFLSLLLFFAISINAQLEVKNTGYVKVTNAMAIGTEPESNTGLYIKRSATGNASSFHGLKSQITLNAYIYYPLYGIYGEANALNVTYMQAPQPIIGVYGIAKKNENLITLAAGVAGLTHNKGGVGVFGGIGSLISSLPANAKYAGYFKGTTMVNGTLLANTIVLNGDTLHLNNIQSLPRSSANSLAQLRPVSYSFKPDTTLQADEKLQREMEGTHYGFIAQDVQKVLPELVYERDGNLSVNYIEMIPLLLQEIQRLSAEIEELKKTNIARLPQRTTDIDQAVLYQNNPNPFSIDTKIEYYLPTSTQSATLYIYNMNGLQVAEYPVTTFGSSEIIVTAAKLDAGMYLYSLVADGNIVDTKRMILTK